MEPNIALCREKGAVLCLGVARGRTLAPGRVGLWGDRCPAKAEMLRREFLLGGGFPEGFCEGARLGCGKMATAIVDKNGYGHVRPSGSYDQIQGPVTSHIFWRYKKATEGSRDSQELMSAL